MTLKPRISQSEEWLSGTKLAASNASESIRREGKGRGKGRQRKNERETDGQKECNRRQRKRETGIKEMLTLNWWRDR